MQTLNEDIIKVLPKGLITIPKKIRQSLGFEENTLVRIRQEKGRVILEPVRALSYPVRNYTNKEIDQFMKLDAKETKKLQAKGAL